MTALLAQLGFAKETTWNTAVTPTRFFEFTGEPVKPVVGRVESKGIRAGARALRNDRSQPVAKGAAGTFELEVPTKGFGFWLEHMLGGTPTIGSVTDSNYTQTAALGSLVGKGFTAQAGKPFNPYTSTQPFTASGGKVTSWALSLEKEGLLMCSLDMDFATHTTATALATASYPANFTQFTWANAGITIGGTSVCVSKFELKCDNGLAVDNYMICNSTTKHEPAESGLRKLSWSLECEFADMTQVNRVLSTTRDGMQAAIVATFLGPEIHGGATLPQLQITLPAARFDDGLPEVKGTDPLTLSLSGIATDDGTATTACQITYRTTDSTP
jgi:hypothetical protein